MKLVQNDIVNNLLPIIIKIDITEYLIPAMCLAKVLEVKDDSIVINFVIPLIDIELLVESKHFRPYIFAVRN